MKLTKRTYFPTSLRLLTVTIIGCIFCFFLIEYISSKEADKSLTYEMQRLIRYHNEHNDLTEFYKRADIIPGIVYNKPVFKDTILPEPGDNKMVPHRELYFTINHKSEHLTFVLRHQLPGRDNVVETTLLIIGGLLLLFISLLNISLE